MKILCFAFALVSLSCSAPTPSHYYVHTPTVTQFIRLQPQIIQSTSELRFQDGKQVLFHYPAAPIAAPTFTTLDTGTYFTTASATRPYQLVALKDEGSQQGFDWMSFFQNWFQGGGSSGSESGAESGAAPPESGAAEGSKMQFDLQKEMMKMSPEKRKEFEKKYLIITGSPFYNDFRSPVFTLQPLAISGRSKESEIKAAEPIGVVETILKPKLAEPLVVVAADGSIITDVLPPVVAKQRRSVEGQEAPVIVPAVAAVETLAQPVEVVAPVVAAPIVGTEKKLDPEMLEMAAEEMVKEEEKKEEMMEEMMVMKEEMAMMEEAKKEPMMEEKKPEAKSAIPVEEEPSIAQAEPIALAISGKDGLAAAAPVAAAVVGDGGIASSEPQAIAISADLTEEQKS